MRAALCSKRCGRSREPLAVDLDLAAREADGIDGQHGSGNQGTRAPGLHSPKRDRDGRRGRGSGLLLERGLGRLLERAVVRRLAAPARGGGRRGRGSRRSAARARRRWPSSARRSWRAPARASSSWVTRTGRTRGDRGGCPRTIDSPRSATRRSWPRARSSAHGARRRRGARRGPDAIAFAARAADVLVLDGVAQLAPVRATLALLAVDARRSLGAPSGAAPSRRAAGPGRRRSSPRATRWCPWPTPPADVARLGATTARSRRVETAVGTCGPRGSQSRGAWVDGGELLTWEAMRSLRVGLLVALGRPRARLRWLDAARRRCRARSSAGATTVPSGLARGRPRARPSSRGIDVWLATPKCALHAARGLPGLPVAVLDHSVALHPSLRKRLRGIAHAAALTGGGGTNSLEVLESTRVVRSTAAPYAPPATPLAPSGEYDNMRPRA